VQVSQVYCGESKDFDTPRTAEDLKLWKLLFRSPIPSWTKGKAVLIGDAAHPMLPRE
jgi:2-polyprenyl-6-methoxyphenol hydroxylase-like FAD-dependent oxidoreductase